MPQSAAGFMLIKPHSGNPGHLFSFPRCPEFSR